MKRTAQKFEPRQTSPLNNIAARRSGGNQVQNSPSRFDMLSSALRSIQSEFFFSSNFDLDILFLFTMMLESDSLS